MSIIGNMALFYCLMFLLLSQYSESFMFDLSKINSLSSILSRYYDTANTNKVAVCGTGNCQGTLWSPDWVLTTIECTQTRPIVVLRTINSKFNCSQLKNNNKIQQSEVREVYHHPNYEAGNVFNIAMLRLSDPLTLNHLNKTNQPLKFFQFESWIDFTITRKNKNPETVARSLEYSKPIPFTSNENIEKKPCKFANPKLQALLCLVTLGLLPIVLGFLAYNLIHYFVKKHEANVRLQHFLYSNSQKKFTDNV